nr:hypothetical protein [Tanacetum cinerariifolium]
MAEGQESVVDDSSIPRNAEHNILGTRLEPRSDKESPKVEFTDVVIPMNVFDEEEEEDEINNEELQGRYGYLFEHLRAKFMQKKSFVTLADHLHEAMADSLPTMVDKHIKEQVQQQVPEQQAISNDIPSQVDASVRSYLSGQILHVYPAQPQTTSVLEQQYQLYFSMKDDPQLQQQDIAIWLALQMKFERLQVSQITCRTPAVRPRDQDDPHDDAHPEGENSAKQHKTSDDDEIPTKQASQDIMEEVSLNIDEAKLKKINDEMLRQRCTLRDEHQYHIDQMNNFLKSNIVWESRKEILVSLHPRKTTPLVLSCQRDPEAPALSLINQDLLYLKKGNSGPEKIV